MNSKSLVRFLGIFLSETINILRNFQKNTILEEDPENFTIGLSPLVIIHC